MAAPTITDALVGEHGVIYALLAHMTSQPVASAEVVRAQAAELAAGLASHAQLEDELLFVPLEGPLGPNGGPLPVMRAEHAEVEGTLERLAQVDDLHEAEELIRHLVTVAREHFEKEEQVLFPMAEQMLGEDVLRGLGERWAVERLGA
jgi:regulator of cell morphogenesis and NO signaling